MTTTATDRAGELLVRAATSGNDLGYPNGVSFLGTDVEDWQGILWDNLLDDRPTALVDEDALEILFVPVDRSTLLAWFDRARGRMPVRVEWRQRGGSHAYRMPVSLSRSRLAEIEPRVAALA